MISIKRKLEELKNNKDKVELMRKFIIERKEKFVKNNSVFRNSMENQKVLTSNLYFHKAFLVKEQRELNDQKTFWGFDHKKSTKITEMFVNLHKKMPSNWKPTRTIARPNSSENNQPQHQQNSQNPHGPKRHHGMMKSFFKGPPQSHHGPEFNNRHGYHHGPPPAWHHPSRLFFIGFILVLFVLTPFLLVFKKKRLEKTTQKNVKIIIDAENLQYYSTKGYLWSIDPKCHTLCLNKSSEAAIFQATNVTQAQQQRGYLHLDQTQNSMSSQGSGGSDENLADRTGNNNSFGMMPRQIAVQGGPPQMALPPGLPPFMSYGNPNGYMTQGGVRPVQQQTIVVDGQERVIPGLFGPDSQSGNYYRMDDVNNQADYRDSVNNQWGHRDSTSGLIYPNNPFVQNNANGGHL